MSHLVPVRLLVTLCAAALTLATTAAGSVPAGAAAAFTIDLKAAPASLAPGGTTTLTATSNQDVGPTDFHINIFDATSGKFLVACGTGTTCSTSVTRADSGARSYVADIASDVAFPPQNPQAVSGTVVVSWISLSLTASPASLPTDTASTVTATSSLDVGPTPFFIEIFDQDGSANFYCKSGTTCSYQATQSIAGTHTYIAYVGTIGITGTPPPPDVRATSNTVTVKWTPAFVNVPDVLNRPRALADHLLTEAGLVPHGTVDKTCVNPGFVNYENPFAGTTVPYGSTVNYDYDAPDCQPPA